VDDRGGLLIRYVTYNEPAIAPCGQAKPNTTHPAA
jgi:hypothetical protein